MSPELELGDTRESLGRTSALAVHTGAGPCPPRPHSASPSPGQVPGGGGGAHPGCFGLRGGGGGLRPLSRRRRWPCPGSHLTQAGRPESSGRPRRAQRPLPPLDDAQRLRCACPPAPRPPRASAAQASGVSRMDARGGIRVPRRGGHPEVGTLGLGPHTRPLLQGLDQPVHTFSYQPQTAAEVTQQLPHAGRRAKCSAQQEINA
nr:uncharacterized protein LOC112922156 [Vulpes vulpes]